MRDGHVALSVQGTAEAMTFVIKDDGPGLSAAALRRLLTSGPVEPGAGVGLRLVGDLVRDLGGTVRHLREDGVTTITVDLPRPAQALAAQ